jgi:hypothetical protein
MAELQPNSTLEGGDTANFIAKPSTACQRKSRQNPTAFAASRPQGRQPEQLLVLGAPGKKNAPPSNLLETNARV